jgi:hypothetical protein
VGETERRAQKGWRKVAQVLEASKVMVETGGRSLDIFSYRSDNTCGEERGLKTTLELG